MEKYSEGPMDWRDVLQPESIWGHILELEIDIRRDPQNAELYLELGIFHGCLKDGEREVKAYRKALELDPSLHQAHYLLGEHYFARKNYWNAAMEFGHYVSEERDDPDGTLYLKFGIACLRLGRVEDAKRHLEKSWHDKDSGRTDVARKILSWIS